MTLVKSEINSRTFHFKKQSDYVYDGSGKKVIKHIVKFENLATEINSLMKKYDLDFKFEADIKHNVSEKKYSIQDLSRESIDIINEYYRDDFDNFGYKIM